MRVWTDFRRGEPQPEPSSSLRTAYERRRYKEGGRGRRPFLLSRHPLITSPQPAPCPAPPLHTLSHHVFQLAPQGPRRRSAPLSPFSPRAPAFPPAHLVADRLAPAPPSAPRREHLGQEGDGRLARLARRGRRACSSPCSRRAGPSTPRPPLCVGLTFSPLPELGSFPCRLAHSTRPRRPKTNSSPSARPAASTTAPSASGAPTTRSRRSALCVPPPACYSLNARRRLTTSPLAMAASPVQQGLPLGPPQVGQVDRAQCVPPRLLVSSSQLAPRRSSARRPCPPVARPLTTMHRPSSSQTEPATTRLTSSRPRSSASPSRTRPGRSTTRRRRRRAT